MTNKTLTLGSLFDGSGGFPLGGLLASITPVWASEIEPFPIRVTTKRLPFMKHYGDISQMDGGKSSQWTSSPLAHPAPICPSPAAELAWMGGSPVYFMRPSESSKK